jgi:hypothetical protein
MIWNCQGETRIFLPSTEGFPGALCWVPGNPVVFTAKKQ